MERAVHARRIGVEPALEVVADGALDLLALGQ